MRWAVVVVAVVVALLAVVDMIVTGQMIRGPAVMLAGRAVRSARGQRARSSPVTRGLLLHQPGRQLEHPFVVRVEFKKALALRSQIRRAEWFN